MARYELGVAAQGPGNLDLGKGGDATVEGRLTEVAKATVGVLGNLHHRDAHSRGFDVHLGSRARGRRRARRMQEQRRHPLMVDGQQRPVGGAGVRAAICGQAEVLQAVVPIAAAKGVIRIVAVVTVGWDAVKQRIAHRNQNPRGVARRHDQRIGDGLGHRLEPQRQAASAPGARRMRPVADAGDQRQRRKACRRRAHRGFKELPAPQPGLHHAAYGWVAAVVGILRLMHLRQPPCVRQKPVTNTITGWPRN